MAIGKRRDDVLLKLSTGTDMRKSIKGYNLELLNVLLALVSAIIIVAYLMYCMDPQYGRQYAHLPALLYRLFLLWRGLCDICRSSMSPPIPAHLLRSFIKTALSR